MKTFWNVIKTFIIAVIITYSIEKGFSYGEFFNISDNRASWFINLAIHTLVLNMIFILLENLIEHNKVKIETFIYEDKEFKDDSNYVHLKTKDPITVYWHLYIDGKRWLLPKYITLPYTNELVIQISKLKNNYIEIDDVKKVIKVRLRGLLPNQRIIRNFDKSLTLLVIGDEDEIIHHTTGINITPQCKRIWLLRKVQTKDFYFKMKGI